MSLEYSIRFYELGKDGALEPLGGGQLELYGGSCPNVGDTIAQRDLLNEGFKFYSVQRRVFIESHDNDQGWAIIIRETEPSALLQNVAREWIDETVFWRETELQERQDEHEQAARTKGTVEYFVRQRDERAKSAPKLGLNGADFQVLRYMLKNQRRKTIDQILGAGPRRMKKLLDAGAVEHSGKTTAARRNGGSQRRGGRI